MTTFMKLFTILSLVFVLTGDLEGKGTPFDGMAATVNHQVITIDQVMEEFRKGYNLSTVPPEERAQRLAELYPQVLDLLIERALILQAYHDASGQLPPDALENHIRGIIVRNFNGNRANLIEALKKSRITYEDWKKETEEMLIISSMRYMQVDKKVTISPAKIRAYYAAHKDSLSLESQVHLYGMMIPKSDGKKVAESALKLVQDGKLFSDVAKSYSKDSLASSGGDYGMVKPADLAPAIQQALTTIKPGEITQVVEIAGDYYLFMKGKDSQTQTVTLATAWTKIEADMRQQESQARYRQWIDSLKQHAVITLSKPNNND